MENLGAATNGFIMYIKRPSIPHRIQSQSIIEASALVLFRGGKSVIVIIALRNTEIQCGKMHSLPLCLYVVQRGSEQSNTELFKLDDEVEMGSCYLFSCIFFLHRESKKSLEYPVGLRIAWFPG